MPPPIPTAPVGTLLLKTPGPSLVIECFLDFCCPFSKKLFTTVSAIPVATLQGRKIDVLFQCVPQPWHPQGAYMHEVALAVKCIDESLFFTAATALFDKQEQFFDGPTQDKSRNQIYSELAAVVAAATGLEATAIAEYVTCAGEGNGGNKATAQMKWAAKYHRVRSIHVTPTVLLNGIEAPDVSSGWTVEQWQEKIVAVLGDAAL
jgi:hypothetical protein